MNEWKYFFLFKFDAREPDYTPGRAKRRNVKHREKDHYYLGLYEIN